jgi:hypothetical protein
LHAQENVTYWLPSLAMAIGKHRNFSIEILSPGDLMLMGMILYTRASLKTHLSGACTDEKALHIGCHHQQWKR